ncbi:MAG: phosphate/phosphite/phosphonate ABC transporter substrate-binding protein [Verrucomicrobiales bacterium]|nr:phosphate/phosphite/phosphonate ABC transporter substrate-binding protein [Verrucomicrobiales bacterium]
MMKNTISLIAAFFAALTLIAPGYADEKSDPDTLRVALLPDENASTIIKANEGLKNYLEAELGKKVEIVVTTDYSSMIEAMRRGRLELGYFGPLSYVLAKDKSPELEPFAAQMKDGSPTYHSVFIGSVEAGIEKPEDVKGKTMAYGDQASTSSHLIPKSLLIDRGLEAGRDYSEQFLGSHDAVALAVQNGNAEVGGMSQPIYEALVAKGTIDPAKVKAIEVSPAYPNYPWTMQGYLAPELKEKIRNAFYNLKDEEILGKLKADGFAEAKDEDYEKVRKLTSILD